MGDPLLDRLRNWSMRLKQFAKHAEANRDGWFATMPTDVADDSLQEAADLDEAVQTITILRENSGIKDIDIAEAYVRAKLDLAGAEARAVEAQVQADEWQRKWLAARGDTERAEAELRLAREVVDAARRSDRSIDNVRFLWWLAERLVERYGESPNVDFVLSLQERADWLGTALAAYDALKKGEKNV